MRPEFHTCDVKYDETAGAASEGAPFELPSICVDHTIQVTGTLTTTDLRVEVSNDGVTWVELDAFTDVGLEVYEGHSFRLLRVRTEAFVAHEPAVMLSSGADFTDLDGKDLVITIDGIEVSVVFTADDDTAAEVAARIDAAAVLAGLPVGTVVAVVDEIQITSEQVGPTATIVTIDGTALADLGLSPEEFGTGDTPAVIYGGMNVRAEA